VIRQIFMQYPTHDVMIQSIALGGGGGSLGGQGRVEDETDGCSHCLLDAVAHDVSPSFRMANMA